MSIIACRICKKRFKKISAISYHIAFRKDHEISNKEYFDKYLKKEKDGICRHCGKPTTFIGLTKGYARFCSKCFHKWKLYESE